MGVYYINSILLPLLLAFREEKIVLYIGRVCVCWYTLNEDRAYIIGGKLTIFVCLLLLETF